MPKPTTRCQNKGLHRSNGEGNILAIIDRDGLYIQCKDRGCKRWTLVEIHIPGVDFDFTKAGITQRLMPKGYHFDLQKAAVVVEE